MSELAAKRAMSELAAKRAMSEPAAERIPKALEAEPAAWARTHLAEDVVGWLTTVAADGRVQSSPVSFLWVGRTVLIYSQPETPKIRNIAANPQVSFHLNTDDYGDHILVFEGTAELDAAAPPWSAHAAMVAKYREPLKHWGLDEAETSRDFSVAIRIRPTRVRAW